MLQFGQWLETAETQYGRPMEYLTRRDVVKRLKHCFHWAYGNGYLPVPLATWLPKVTGSTRMRKRASLDDLYALVEAAGRSGEPIRDQAFVALLIGTGLRKMEAVNLDVGDIEMNDDLAGTIAVGHAKRVNGRLVQGRVVAFDGWTGHFLKTLIDTFPEPSGPVFRVPRSAERMGGQAAYRVVKRAVARAGLEDVLDGPHDLRRNFATWFSVKNRGELYGRLLSKQLGHSSFVQTDEYVLHEAEDLIAVISNPLAGRPAPKPRRRPTEARRQARYSIERKKRR